MGTGSYFDKALCGTNAELIEAMRLKTKGVEYDTIIGTGLSGTIFTARVAPGLRKKFAIVRKDGDGSHSGIRVEGQVGKRWIFADDFICGGGTMKRVLNMMKKKHPEAVFVGCYQYERDEVGRFQDPDLLAQIYGSWVTELSIGCKLGPRTRAQMLEAEPWLLESDIVLKRPLEGWTQAAKKFIKISGIGDLTVDYPDGYGRPTIYDNPKRTRFTCEDAQALKYVEMVEKASRESGVSLRRLAGERLDRLPKPRVRIQPNRPTIGDWARTPEVEALRRFNEDMQKADEAAMRDRYPGLAS